MVSQLMHSTSINSLELGKKISSIHVGSVLPDRVASGRSQHSSPTPRLSTHSTSTNPSMMKPVATANSTPAASVASTVSASPASTGPQRLTRGQSTRTKIARWDNNI